MRAIKESEAVAKCNELSLQGDGQAQASSAPKRTRFGSVEECTAERIALRRQ